LPLKSLTLELFGVSGAWLPVAMVELPISTGGVADLPVFVDEK